MDGMLSALKQKRGGLLSEEDAPQMDIEKPGSESSDIKGLVDSLDENEKAMLLQMLVRDQAANDKAPEIAQGKAPGPGEGAELEEFVSQMEPEDDQESEDEMMESMISSADKTRAAQGTSPRNLGERMKINLANKLKEKKG